MLAFKVMNKKELSVCCCGAPSFSSHSQWLAKLLFEHQSSSFCANDKKVDNLLAERFIFMCISKRGWLIYFYNIIKNEAPGNNYYSGAERELAFLSRPRLHSLKYLHARSLGALWGSRSRVSNTHTTPSLNRMRANLHLSLFRHYICARNNFYWE